MKDGLVAREALRHVEVGSDDKVINSIGVGGQNKNVKYMDVVSVWNI